MHVAGAAHIHIHIASPTCPPATCGQVKYPASQPALPVGLTGSSFGAVFGGNQSMLEALTLKRHIMGPCWLAVKHPRRVAAESQVCPSHCGVHCGYGG